MNKTLSLILSIVALVVIITAANGFFIVNETQHAIISQFGKPV